MHAPREGPVRIAVLNDYSVVVAGVSAMLAPHRDRVEVVERHTGRDVAGSVDLVLYDTFATPRDPAEVVSSIVERNGTPLVVFSWTSEEELVRRCLDAGAVGFVPKSLGPEELAVELERIHRRSRRVSTPPSGGSRTQPGDWPGSGHGLSAREAEVVALIARGLSNQEIASLTFLSINSVKTYIRTAYRRMGVTSRSQAVLWAMRHGFDPTSPTDWV